LATSTPTRAARDLPAYSDISDAEEEGSSTSSAFTPRVLQQILRDNAAQMAAVAASVTGVAFSMADAVRELREVTPLLKTIAESSAATNSRLAGLVEALNLLTAAIKAHAATCKDVGCAAQAAAGLVEAQQKDFHAERQAVAGAHQKLAVHLQTQADTFVALQRMMDLFRQ
jgi:ABC-type transporter Mla subunit MlaD